MSLPAEALLATAIVVVPAKGRSCLLCAIYASVEVLGNQKLLIRGFFVCSQQAGEEVIETVMATPKKEQAVAELTALVQESSSVVLADYRGLTMKDFNELRARLRPEQVEFHVVKNTLLRRASSGTALSELAEALEGPTAIAVSLGDSVAGPRLLNQYIRDSRSPMTIKSGVVDGTAYDGGAIEQIAKLPPRDQMIAQVLGGLQAPIANLAGTLQTMLGSLVWTLTGIAEQKA